MRKYAHLGHAPKRGMQEVFQISLISARVFLNRWKQIRDCSDNRSLTAEMLRRAQRVVQRYLVHSRSESWNPESKPLRSRDRAALFFHRHKPPYRRATMFR